MYAHYTHPQHSNQGSNDTSPDFTIRQPINLERTGSLNVANRKRDTEKINLENQQIIKTLNAAMPSQSVTVWKKFIKQYEQRK